MNVTAIAARRFEGALRQTKGDAGLASEVVPHII